MEDYIKEVNTNIGREYDLARFLKRYKININEVASEKKIPIIGKFSGKEIYTFISENGKHYIPGSSIKGAIRNALAFEFLKDNQEKITELSRKTFDKRRNKPSFSKEDKSIFGRNPNYDILKFLQVGDSKFFNNATAIYITNTYHLKKNNIAIPINYECIQPNYESTLRIVFKKNLTNVIGSLDTNFWNEYLSIKGIFKALNNFSLKFIERELNEIGHINDLSSTIKFYKELKSKIAISENKKAYFCLGKGTGIFNKTILLNLKDKNIEVIRDKMKWTKKARNFGWKYIKGEDWKKSDKFPVTRLVYKNNENWQTGIGWMKMEKI